MTSAQHEGREPANATPTRGWLPVRPRERLQNAADRLFPSSIRAASIDAISAEANVPKSGFYRHFPSKDDLIEDYLHRRGERIREALRQIEAEEKDPRRRLVKILALEADNALVLRAAAEFPEPHTTVSLMASRHRQWVRQWISNQLVELDIVDPHLIALELAAILDALAFEPPESTEHHQTQRVLQRRIEMLQPEPHPVSHRP